MQDAPTSDPLHRTDVLKRTGAKRCRSSRPDIRTLPRSEPAEGATPMAYVAMSERRPPTQPIMQQCLRTTSSPMRGPPTRTVTGGVLRSCRTRP